MLRQLAFAAILAFSPMVSAAAQGVQKPIGQPTLGTDTVHGCYSSKGTLDDGRHVDFNAQGSCNIYCRDKLKKPVAATYADQCYCGDAYPPKSTLVDPSKCTEPCPGFGTEACGGLNTFTVYNTGVRVSVADSPDPTTSSAGSSPTSAAPVASDPVSATPSSSDPNTDTGGSPTVAIAVGVVVGIVALAGIAGGAFFFLRRRKNTEIEEEHRRNAAVNAFIYGGKPPASSDGVSMSDSRLDPVIANRRMSDGSIADNQDYSRRILRVTNA